MGKTTTKEQVQAIDPQMRAESEALTGLGRGIARMGYNPYEGNTIADFTGGQKAAFQMADQGAGAFGMQGGLMDGLPGGATVDPRTGVRGFSPEQRIQQQPGYADMRRQVDALYQQAGRDTPKQKQHKAGGGKK